MNCAEIQHLADALTAARLTGAPYRLADGDHPQTEEDGYAVQEAGTRATLIKGYRLGGYKVGLVTAQIREQTGGSETLGVDGPVYGTILADRIFKNRADVRLVDFVQLYVEGEFAVRIGDDVPVGADHTRESICDHVESCLAAIEIVEFRLPYFDYTPPLAPLMIADSGSNWGAVIGDPVANWQRLELNTLSASMYRDGEQIAVGNACHLLGHPFEVLAWLGNRMNRRGATLRRGDVVLLGSVTPSYKVCNAGTEIEVRWDAFGSVCMSIG